MLCLCNLQQGSSTFRHCVHLLAEAPQVKSTNRSVKTLPGDSNPWHWLTRSCINCDETGMIFILYSSTRLSSTLTPNNATCRLNVRHALVLWYVTSAVTGQLRVTTVCMSEPRCNQNKLCFLCCCSLKISHPATTELSLWQECKPSHKPNLGAQESGSNIIKA